MQIELLSLILVVTCMSGYYYKSSSLNLHHYYQVFSVDVIPTVNYLKLFIFKKGGK